MTRITERMMRAGSFTIDFKPETPESVRSVIRAAVGQDADGTSSPTHGHFVVTVARIPVGLVTAPGGIYTGRLVAQEGRNSFSGVGLAGWLGVNGQTGPRVKTRTAAARNAQAIVSISLANGITAGTITPAGGPTVQESEFGMVTYSERLSAMARQLGHEWHVNAAGQLNVADAADLYPVTPAVMFTDMTKQLASVDGGIRLVDSDARAPKIQAGQRASVTRAVLTLEPPTTVDTAAATVAYDIDGNVAELHRHIDHLDGTATTGAAIAAEVQGRFGSPEADFGVRVNGDRWRLFVNPGELCYAYFPTAGIRDITNLVDIGGTTFPRLLRIQQVDWSPSEGDGVYFVPAPGQGDTIDLSDWFVPGTGGSVVVGVGNGDADVVESVAVARWSESERLQPRGGAGGGGAVPDPLLLSDGSAAAPTYSFASDPDTGIYRAGTNEIGFTAGGVELLSVGSADVDVVTGHLNVFSNTGSDTISLGEYSGGSNLAAIETSSFYALMGTGNANDAAYLRTKGSGPLILGASHGSNLTIANGGNVGIGTTSPNKALDVVDSGTTELSIRSTTSVGDSALLFGNVDDTYQASIFYDASAQSLNLRGYNNTTRLTIASTGEITGTMVQASNAVPGASKLVKSRSNGYTYLGWLNTVSGSNTNTPSRIYTNNGGTDSFVRYMTLANFRTSVADQTKFCSPPTRAFNYSGNRNVNGQYSFTFASTIGGVSLSGAKAIIVNLAVRSAGNSYFVAWKYGTTLPGIALVNLVPNVFGNVQATIPMDTSRRIRYMYGASSGNYTIFDVIGVVF